MSDREPPGSIIERFRGTEWESPPPAPMAPPPRRGGGLAVLLVAIVAIGGLIVGVVAVLPRFQGGEPTGPALRDPDITPRVPDSIRVLEAFWAVVRDPELTYHLEGIGSSHSEDFDSSFELSLDIAGDDFTGTVNTIGGSGFAEIIRLDHVVYIRQPGEDWILGRTNDAALRQDPFMGLTGRRELVYDERLIEDGLVLHRLVTTEWYAPSVERMLDLGAFRFPTKVRSLELFVTDDGVPVRATFTCIVEGSLVDGIPHFEGTAEYTFSGVGEAVVIQTPSP